MSRKSRNVFVLLPLSGSIVYSHPGGNMNSTTEPHMPPPNLSLINDRFWRGSRRTIREKPSLELSKSTNFMLTSLEVNMEE